MRKALGVFVGFIAVGVFGCNSNSAPTSAANTTGNPSTAGTAGTSSTPTSTGDTAKLTSLKVEDVKVGKGLGAKAGDKLTMTYTGKLANGTVFDTNDKPDGQPFTFVLGAGSVIKGWDQGLAGMKVGGVRKLSIPSELGYGAKDSGKIPPNSDLFFDVALKSRVSHEDINSILLDDKKVGTGRELKKGDTAKLTYTTLDESGSVLDDKYAKAPLTAAVGVGKLQPVIDKAILGMKLGGERVLTIPGEMLPAGPAIHPGMTITMDIHLIGIQ